MSRLPVPGSDSNSWGTILNDFLAIAHNSDGTVKAQASIDAKAPLASPTFTGAVTVPTPTNSSDAATKAYVDNASGATSRFVPRPLTSSAAVLDYSFVIADATSGNIVVTLPAAVSGGWVRVKKVDASANSVTVAPVSGQIDNLSNVVISIQWQCQDFASDGVTWYRI